MLPPKNNKNNPLFSILKEFEIWRGGSLLAQWEKKCRIAHQKHELSIPKYLLKIVNIKRSEWQSNTHYYIRIHTNNLNE